jgi:hypothetical protein
MISKIRPGLRSGGLPCCGGGVASPLGHLDPIIVLVTCHLMIGCVGFGTNSSGRKLPLRLGNRSGRAGGHDRWVMEGGVPTHHLYKGARHGGDPPFASRSLSSFPHALSLLLASRIRSSTLLCLCRFGLLLSLHCCLDFGGGSLFFPPSPLGYLFWSLSPPSWC